MHKFVFSYNDSEDHEDIETYEDVSNSVGRPEIPFSLCNERTQKNKISDLDKSLSVDEVCEVAKKKMKPTNNLAGVQLVDQIFHQDRAKHLLEAASKKSSRCMTPDEALALMLEGNLTKKV
ncbi:hypothetical protein TKK_0016606 [Trichogramma kaykai]